MTVAKSEVSTAAAKASTALPTKVSVQDKVETESAAGALTVQPALMSDGAASWPALSTALESWQQIQNKAAELKANVPQPILSRVAGLWAIGTSTDPTRLLLLAIYSILIMFGIQLVARYGAAFAFLAESAAVVLVLLALYQWLSFAAIELRSKVDAAAIAE